MDIKRRLLLIVCALASAGFSARGQVVGVKTNLLDDVFANINIGLEAGVAPRWTVEVPVSLNYWIFKDDAWVFRRDGRWKHYALQPGVRYWFCSRFSGHFLGAHLHGGQYNVGGFKSGLRLPGWNGDGKYVGTDFSNLDDTRLQGWFVGGGISYGYAFILGRHWNLELELGVGYSYTRYDQFRCTGCGKKVAEDVPHHYAGPTKAAINLVYLF